MSDTIDDPTTHEKELQILETIHAAGQEDKPVVQRDIAHIVGVSLGMTNAILKRLVKKGLLTIRKVNNRNIHYAVSPEGMKALSEKSYRYFKRTIKNVVYYKEKIEKIIEDAKVDGFEKVVLVGDSDLDFIVQHFCFRYGIIFEQKLIINNRYIRNELVIYSENYGKKNDSNSNEGHRNTNELTYFLHEIFVK